MNNKLFSKIILFTVDVYVDKMKNEGAPIPDILHKMKIAIVGYKYRNKFTDEERKLVLGFAKEQELKDIIEVEISHLIFILTVIKLWIELIPKTERPILNISDKRLIKGKAEYAMHMLKLKQNDKESYEEKKDVIDTSVKTAEAFIEYHIKKLSNKETL